jgi:hypothetical protein
MSRDLGDSQAARHLRLKFGRPPGCRLQLARGWKRDPRDVLDSPTGAPSDQQSGMRQAAFQELALGWKGPPGMNDGLLLF